MIPRLPWVRSAFLQTAILSGLLLNPPCLRAAMPSAVAGIQADSSSDPAEPPGPDPFAGTEYELPAPSPTGEAPSADEGESSTATVLVRMILVLMGVVLLAYLLLHKGLGSLSKKLARGRLVRVVDRVGLEPKKALYVVEVADRYYLIGTTDHGVSCLATLGEGDASQVFAEALGRKRVEPTTVAGAHASPEGEGHVES